MTATRKLIVNADDFGRSLGINRGVAQAHERGVVTSASLMVRWPAAADAAEYAGHHPLMSVGLHVDLGEWVYVDGSWTSVYQVVPCDDPTLVREEALRQLAAFRAMVGRNPTHLDSHQHVHRDEPVRSVLAHVAAELGVPLRECAPGVRYRGDFFGQTAEGLPFPCGITVANLLRIAARLRPGLTELGCHPGWPDDHDLDSVYAAERTEELRALCDPRVRQALTTRGVELCSFHQVR
jgi:chitin disaccharide deacetylase